MPQRRKDKKSPTPTLRRRSARLAGFKEPLEFVNGEVEKSPRKKSKKRAKSKSRKKPRTPAKKKRTHDHAHGGATCSGKSNGSPLDQLNVVRVNKARVFVGCAFFIGITFFLVTGDNSLSVRTQLFKALASCVLVTVFAAVSPIPQDENYHNFADQRTLCGCIPNYMDVLSNIPFLVVGVLGLDALYPGDYVPSDANLFSTNEVVVNTKDERQAWTVFFVGVLLVSFGSGYYHWYRTSETLVWDRLPMTVAFMSTFALQCMERLGNEFSWVLRPAILIGIFSVFWWRHSGDLRLYIVVQFFPLIAMPILIAAFPPKYSHSGLLLVSLGFYILCKIVEILDKEIFRITRGVISGHTLKHLTAAVSPLVAIYYLAVRRPI